MADAAGDELELYSRNEKTSSRFSKILTPSPVLPVPAAKSPGDVFLPARRLLRPKARRGEHRQSLEDNGGGWVEP
jgi:hypothetical protein